MRIKFTLAALFFCGFLYADPVVHKFGLWEKGTERDKLSIYWGWTNGFFQARGPRGMDLLTCLSRISPDQAVAMVDKQYKNHPEKWSRPLGEQILEALTVNGGPCEGKNPL